MKIGFISECVIGLLFALAVMGDLFILLTESAWEFAIALLFVPYGIYNGAKVLSILFG